MSVNSSFLSSSSLDSEILHCPNSTAPVFFSSAFSLTRVFVLLPLSILILYLGYRRWRQQRSFKSMSHSDMFTYHNAVLELIWGLGTTFYISGIFCDLLHMEIVGIWLFSLVFSGETSFHLLTCVERYLAVVHPIIYLGLRNARGVRIRNISIGCAWLLSFIWCSIATLNSIILLSIVFCCLLLFALVVVSFCSLSVLCVLIRPGPGHRGGDREQTDQTKQRAFFTIMAIMAVLWLWFICLLVSVAVHLSSWLCNSSVPRASGHWFSLPASLVLPLLYLHRTGKLSCCRYESG